VLTFSALFFFFFFFFTYCGFLEVCAYAFDTWTFPSDKPWVVHLEFHAQRYPWPHGPSKCRLDRYFHSFQADIRTGRNKIRSHETDNFLAFLELLRQYSTGKKLILTANAEMKPWFNSTMNVSTNLTAFTDVLDWVNIMVCMDIASSVLYPN
jgi:hypothetical protein